MNNISSIMFRKMRRAKQELSKDECIEILTNEPRGVLALLGDYDYTYALPMTHVYVDGKIYFHGAQTGHKKDAVKKHDKISYCVMDKGVLNDDGWSYTFRSVIVFGTIRTLDDDNEKIDKLTYWATSFSRHMRRQLMKSEGCFIKLRFLKLQLII